MSDVSATGARIERIFVSWTQQWDLATYIDHFLRTRRIPVTDQSRERVWRCLAAYHGQMPHTKSDLDYFLDANLDRDSARR